MEFTLRTAGIDDAQALLDIYAYYVEHSALTFEYEVPSLQEFRRRIAGTLEHYPYLLAESSGRIVGYSYAGRFQPRAAYAWNAEMTIYLEPGMHRQGIGRRLYTLMERLLAAQGVVKTIAMITRPTDEFSDFNSVPFHEKMGYRPAGRLDFCGFKFGRWYTTLCMDKQIGTPAARMCPVRDFGAVRKDFGL